jgi:hypothetical protein
MKIAAFGLTMLLCGVAPAIAQTLDPEFRGARIGMALSEFRLQRMTGFDGSPVTPLCSDEVRSRLSFAARQRSVLTPLLLTSDETRSGVVKCAYFIGGPEIFRPAFMNVGSATSRQLEYRFWDGGEGTQLYKIEAWSDEANTIEFGEALVEKFGPPTSGSIETGQLLWRDGPTSVRFMRIGSLAVSAKSIFTLQNDEIAARLAPPTNARDSL